MKKKATYHCHTNFSDGSNTVREMIEAAITKGFDEIGFSDHLVLHPTIPDIFWSMKLDQVSTYTSEVRKLAEEYTEIKVLTGSEVDFFPGNPRADVLLAILDENKFDFIIGSVHMLKEFSLDDKAEYWAPLSMDEVNQKYIDYYQALQDMVKWHKFDFIGHFDLPKKFCFHPSINMSEIISDTLDAIKASNTPLEINTAGWDKDCQEAYPSLEILKECTQKDIPILINDDAHCCEDLGRYYNQAEDLLKQAGCKQTWSL